MENDLIKPGDILLFNKEVFTKDYFDLQGDLPNEVMILNTTIYGVLVFDNKVLKANDIFKLEEIDKLKYIRISKQEYTENITFKVNDINPNKLFSNMATFTINVNEYVNLPPDAVGDNDLTVNNDELVVFTPEDFTTNTTPPYDDPEGDPPYKLKVLSLPTDGSKLILGASLVTLNQEILFTDIEAGLLTLEQYPNSTEHSFSFDFDISDMGSHEYSGL